MLYLIVVIELVEWSAFLWNVEMRQHVWDTRKKVRAFVACTSNLATFVRVLVYALLTYCLPVQNKTLKWTEKSIIMMWITLLFSEICEKWCLRLKPQRLQRAIKISDSLDVSKSYSLFPLSLSFYPFLQTNVFYIWHCIRHKGQRIPWFLLFTTALIYSSSRFFFPPL